MNSSLLFIAKFGIPQCLPKHPQTPPAIDLATLLVEVAEKKCWRHCVPVDVRRLTNMKKDAIFRNA